MTTHFLRSEVFVKWAWVTGVKSIFSIWFSVFLKLFSDRQYFRNFVVLIFVALLRLLQKQWIEFNEKLVVYENYLYRIITEASLDFAWQVAETNHCQGWWLPWPLVGQSVLGFATTLSPLDSRHTGLHQQVKHPTIESVFNFHNIRTILFREVIKH